MTCLGHAKVKLRKIPDFETREAHPTYAGFQVGASAY
jgi:hypothetical protein